MKIIAVDIGNTTTCLAVLEHNKVHSKTVLDNKHIEQFPVELKTLAGRKVGPVVICSVRPDICKKVARSVKLASDAKHLVIGKTIPLPIELDLADPAGVGHDRVLGAAMAYERINGAVVVADFGTAMTIDCVNDAGVFLGGAIAPGLKIAAEALAQSTAALPMVDKPTPPKTSWGRTTTEAISAGLIFAAVGALQHIVERYAADLGGWPEVILTGGDAPLIAEHCDFVNAVVPDLVLMGIELAYERYRQSQTHPEN